MRKGSRLRENPYSGFVPIAACHWQSIANVLHGHGFADAYRRLGLAWGVRWKGGEILFGANRWPQMLKQVFGVVVNEFSWVEPRLAESHELNISYQGLPFVAEVDAYYLPSPYYRLDHVVHTVIVLECRSELAVLSDSTNNPKPVQFPAEVYRLMRESKCLGRTDSHKIYVPQPASYRYPDGAAIADAIREDVYRHQAEDLTELDRFIDSFASTGNPINVCRVGAERYQASHLYELLADHGVSEGRPLAAELRVLSDGWYMVHMISVHNRSGEARQRNRMLRLLTRLAHAERSLFRRVLSREVMTC